jgi:DNA invertase Pin-like site-specific DNA recombinase
VTRKVWAGMLDRLTQGDFGAVLVYDLDRAVQDPRDFEDLIDLNEQ